MSDHPWVRGFPGGITVTDQTGAILELNDAAAAAFQKEGGLKLLGSNVLDCHPEPARTKLRNVMARRDANVYTIEKKGRKKLIYQSPWYRDGQYAGFVELSLEIPWEVPHFIRE
ncbi:MAG: diguanylate cyclase [Acidobacteria bacterium]|nr:diguanylate cyclase [Acidobacteriota bacterium]